MSFAELQARLDAAKGDTEALAKSAAAAAADEANLGDGAGEGGDGGEGAGDGGDAGAGGAEGGAGDGGDGGEGGNGEGNEGDELLGKSFQLTLEDGTVVEAQDGAALVKAMLDRQADTDEVLQKSVGAVLDMVGDLKGALQATQTKLASQDALIKSLRSEIAALGTKGSGRVASLSVMAKSNIGGAAAKAATKKEGMTRDEVLAKAVSLQKSGALTGLQVATVESDLNAGRKPAAEVMALIAKP